MWRYLEVSNLDEVLPYIRSALLRGLDYYHMNLIENLSSCGKQCLFKIENDTLYVGRLGCMGIYFFKLFFPPIHLSGDKEIEKEALYKCIENGLSVWIEEGQSKELGLKCNKPSEYVGGHQLIYQRNFEMSGKKYKNIRWERNKFLSQVEKGELKVVLDYPLKNLSNLTSTWIKQKKLKKSVFNFCIKHERHLKPYLRNLTTLNEKGHPITSTLFCAFTPKIWYWIGAVSDFDKIGKGGTQRQSNLYIFHLEQSLEKVIAGGYLNKDMKFSKCSIPHSIFITHTLPSRVKLTKQQWLSFKPPPLSFKEKPCTS